jgi:hypothetical protein
MARTEVTPDAPGWYADPKDPSRLAYWDGKAWTGDHRPRPSWQPADPRAVAAAEREARRRWAHGWRSWAMVGGVLVLIVVLAWVTLPKPEKLPPAVVTDAAFVTSANALCKSTINGLRPQPKADGSDPTPEEVAADIERVATGLDDLATKLRAMPIAPADQPHIAGWLDGWGRYTDLGRQYASALRARDEKGAVRVSGQADDVQKSVDRFARSNDIDSCQFFIVPRGTGSDPFSGGG